MRGAFLWLDLIGDCDSSKLMAKKLSPIQAALLRFNGIDPDGLDTLDYEIELDNLSKHGDRRLIDIWQDYRGEHEEEILKEGPEVVPFGIGERLLKEKLSKPKVPTPKKAPTKIVLSKTQAESREGKELVQLICRTCSSTELSKDDLKKLRSEVTKYEKTWDGHGGVIFLIGQINMHIADMQGNALSLEQRIALENAMLRLLPKSMRDNTSIAISKRLESEPISKGQISMLQFYGVTDSLEGMFFAEAKRRIDELGVADLKQHMARQKAGRKKRMKEVKREIGLRDAQKSGCALIIGLAVLLLVLGTGVVVASQLP